MSELWGDVCLGLLFWGLANDITSLEDAGDHSLCVHVWCVCK
jgi:ATP/ADP translocase